MNTKLLFLTAFALSCNNESIDIKTTAKLAIAQKPGTHVADNDTKKKPLAITTTVTNLSYKPTSTEIWEIAAWFIKSRENFRLKPYKCAAGQLTIGWGRSIDKHETTTVERENKLFVQKLQAIFESIHTLLPNIKGTIYTAAIADLFYNTGVHSDFEKTKLFTLLKNNRFNEAAVQITKYNKIHHKGKSIKLDALVERRAFASKILLNKFELNDYLELSDKVKEINAKQK